jgi:autotransporter-associated beta strand protein
MYFVCFGVCLCGNRLAADTGFWTTTGGGSWANSANWDSDIIADGADETAYFGLDFFANIPASATFTLNGARTIGNLYFTDDDGPDNWFLNTGSGGPLTMEASFDFPSITVDTQDQQVTINAVLAGVDGLEKLGAGTLVLNATNIYSGETVVSAGVLKLNGVISNEVSVDAGTLGGTGMISGPVTVEARGTLAPGNSIGTITISNSLSLLAGSKTFVEVNASTLARDFVKGLSSVNYGGTLIVSNLAGTPTLGQSFQLFSTTNAAGNFNFLTPQLNGALRWRFNPANGTLSVISSNLQPRFASVTPLSPTNLLLLVTNGVPSATNYLLASTKLALSKTNWTRVATNVFDAAGNLSFTNAISSAPQRFFVIQQQ